MKSYFILDKSKDVNGKTYPSFFVNKDTNELKNKFDLNKNDNKSKRKIIMMRRMDRYGIPMGKSDIKVLINNYNNNSVFIYTTLSKDISDEVETNFSNKILATSYEELLIKYPDIYNMLFKVEYKLDNNKITETIYDWKSKGTPGKFIKIKK